MTIAIDKEKEKWRQEMRRRLYAQKAEDRERRSGQIYAQVDIDPAFRESGHVMIYVAREEEVETKKLIERALEKGKCVTVPCVDSVQNELVAVKIDSLESDLKPGAYGILEPHESLRQPFCIDDLEFVIVPGLAFDRAGYRLGRGKGYYDRFLARLNERVHVWGLGFDFQILNSIPHLRHDVQLDRVITN